MTPRSLFLLLIFSAAGGCAPQQPPAVSYADRPAFLVPSASLIYPAVTRNPEDPNPAWQVLPTSDAEHFAVGRPEKFLYGSMPLSAYSAFTIYTYDYQRISTPRGGWGYRQTYSVRTGEQVP